MPHAITRSVFTGRDASKDRGQTQEGVRGRADQRLEAVASRSGGQLLSGAVQPAAVGCRRGGPSVEHLHVGEVQLLTTKTCTDFRRSIYVLLENNPMTML